MSKTKIDIKLEHVKLFFKSLTFLTGAVVIVFALTVALVSSYRFICDPVDQWLTVDITVSTAQAEVLYRKDMSVTQKIYFYSDLYGVDRGLARKMAQCESGFNPEAKNKNSTAKGVYQFIDGTWERNCGGDVTNPDHNIICFVQKFPQHPTWWEECVNKLVP